MTVFNGGWSSTYTTLFKCILSLADGTDLAIGSTYDPSLVTLYGAKERPIIIRYDTSLNMLYGKFMYNSASSSDIYEVYYCRQSIHDTATVGLVLDSGGSFAFIDVSTGIASTAVTLNSVALSTTVYIASFDFYDLTEIYITYTTF